MPEFALHRGTQRRLMGLVGIVNQPVEQSLPAEVAQGCSSWFSSKRNLHIRSAYSVTAMRARRACKCCSLRSELMQDNHMQIKRLLVPTARRI
jgi:hypothetical protein